MKLFIAGALILFSLQSFSQQARDTENIDSWKKAVVKIESIQQRYNFKQVDSILKKQTEGVKGLSQHARYNTQGELLTISDTIRGSGILVAGGPNIYLLTAKHLIKATENTASGAETINNLITIRTNIAGKISNDISLMNLSENKRNLQPFIFSSDQNDIGIVSFQKQSYKPILAYLKRQGCVPIPIKAISIIDNAANGDEILAVGFPAIPGPDLYTPAVIRGNINSINRTQSAFAAGLHVYPGNSGGPVIKNDKLIGILSFQNGISTNIDAAAHPYDRASSAKVVNASLIFPLLNELQRHERNALFK